MKRTVFIVAMMIASSTLFAGSFTTDPVHATTVEKAGGKGG